MKSSTEFHPLQDVQLNHSTASYCSQCCKSNQLSQWRMTKLEFGTRHCVGKIASKCNTELIKNSI